MTEYQITNGIISVKISNVGVELRSLQDCTTQEEFLWDANPKYWNRISPLLFPFIGGLKNKEYHYQGTTYPMEKHGFVRDAEFTLTKQEKDEVWFSLKADHQTKKIYPFDFLLEVGYRLEGRKVEVIWNVQNQEAKDMYFSIGGHPAIKCPRTSEEKQTDCYLAFPQRTELRNTLIGADGLASKESSMISLNNGIMPIEENLFAHDALVIEDYQVNEIQFLDSEKQAYCKVTFDLPVVGIWSPSRISAPFICIEPWDGICDATDFEGQLEERKWGKCVRSGEIYRSGYAIEI